MSVSYKHVLLTADWSVFGCCGSDGCSFIGSACFGLSAYRDSGDRLHDNDTLGRNDIKRYVFPDILNWVNQLYQRCDKVLSV